jgi:hypothetical protein
MDTTVQECVLYSYCVCHLQSNVASVTWYYGTVLMFHLFKDDTPESFPLLILVEFACCRNCRATAHADIAASFSEEYITPMHYKQASCIPRRTALHALTHTKQLPIALCICNIAVASHIW